MTRPLQNEWSPNRLFKERLQRIRRMILAVTIGAVLVLASLLLLVPVDERILATGYVRAERDTRLYAPVDGVVEEVHAREGEAVRAGEPVVSLDGTEMRARLVRIEAERARAEAELAYEEARVENLRRLPLPVEFRQLENAMAVAVERTAQAKVEYARARELTQRRIITGQEMERARLAWELRKLEELRVEEQHRLVEGGMEASILREAEAGLEAKRAVVRVVEAARQEGEAELERLILRAPEDGVVTLLGRRRAGQRVERGDSLVHLAHGAASRVDLWAGESQFYRVKPGQRLVMRSLTFDSIRSGYVEGRVERVGLEPEPGVWPMRGGAEPGRGYFITGTIDSSPVELSLGSTVEARVILQRTRLWRLLLPTTRRD